MEWVKPGRSDVPRDFFMITPMDTSFAQVRTDVRMEHDEEHLLIWSVINHHSDGKGPYMVESLRRDFFLWKKWQLPAFHDPFDDKTNDFSFWWQMRRRPHKWMVIMSNGAAWIWVGNNKWTSKVHQLRRQWILWSSHSFTIDSLQKRDFRMGINFFSARFWD